MAVLSFLLVLATLTARGCCDSLISRTVSSNAGLRLAPLPPVHWGHDPCNESRALGCSAPRVVVHPERKLQRMRGFGASFLESGAINLNSLPSTKQEELLDLLFSDSGAKLSAMKAPIPCDDFCAAGPWYTYDDVPGDLNLTHFSIARDLRQNGTLTFVQRAQRHGFDGMIQSYMDYPPDWMLAGNLPDHATVDPRYYDTLALYFAKFVQAYAAHGVHVDYLSLFNEPVDSYTNITDSELADLLGKHVGPLFDKLGLRPGTKLTSAGQCSRETAGEHIPGVMAHPTAARYMDHMAYHGYDCQFNCTKERQNYATISELHQFWPELELFLTEICYAYNGDDPACERASTMSKCTDWPRNHSLAPALPRFSFLDGRVWGSRLASEVKAGVSGWIYWNLILDMQGGPFQLSPKHNDNGANLQQAVIHVDAANQEFHTTGLFWYLAHFSKFVVPGMRQIQVVQPDELQESPEGSEGVEAVAFLKDDGLVVLQLMNHDLLDQTVTIACSGKIATLKLPSASITTAKFYLD